MFILLISLQKVAQRKKILKSSTSTSDHDKTKVMVVLKVEYMSSDESATDDSGLEHEGDTTTTNKRLFLTKKLAWRSTELDSTLQARARQNRDKQIFLSDK
ncbi:hypothetical protein OS493_036992 [Desmophyllum pertusum]|uniref:Uncharacterized protein n=1 Tax=Desmophyllum pertusum TaxID=174260 RepID=A0A9W9YUG7_9CNID|nr:hypothetical protein OS493_036992 [Desmophyllum pertusum]